MKKWIITIAIVIVAFVCGIFMYNNSQTNQNLENDELVSDTISDENDSLVTDFGMIFADENDTISVDTIVAVETESVCGQDTLVNK